jgi:hypothetical protein
MSRRTLSEALQFPLTLRLPAKHAADWHDRLGCDLGVHVVKVSERAITLTFPGRPSLRDLVNDAEHYLIMKGEMTMGVDYSRAARTMLDRLELLGVTA